MSIPVRLPTAFKKFTSGETLIEFDESVVPTVGAMTEELFKRYPELRAQMFARGEQHRFVNIFVNGLDTRFGEGLGQRLHPGDQIQIVLAIAGGAN